jgi:hypothetical protein
MVTMRDGTRFRDMDLKTRRRLRNFAPLLIIVVLSFAPLLLRGPTDSPCNGHGGGGTLDPRQEAATIGAFARPQVAADRLPQDSCAIQALLEATTLYAFPWDESHPGDLRLTTSRLLLTVDEPARVTLYVVQTDKGWVCSVLVPSGPEHCSSDFGYTLWTPTSERASGTYVFGLAPDDVTVVEVRFEDETCRAPVVANGFFCSSTKTQTAFPQVSPISTGAS